MFYVQFPKGNVSLHVLEESVITRLQYLDALYNEKTSAFQGNIGCLLEGSTIDAIGHFILRLLSSTSPEFQSYWVTRETLLFKHRLNYSTTRQLHRLFRNIIRNIKKQTDKDSIDNTLVTFAAHFLKNSIFQHTTAKNHSPFCKESCITVDFELVPDLVSNREVILEKGKAQIYCFQWKSALIHLFQSYLTWKVALGNVTKVQDARLISLNQRIQYSLLSRGLSSGQITFSNIDYEASKFPPCMRHLHKMLRQRHRLSHYARLYYSLFLKECGMPIEDAVEYWKAEYSQPHTCGSACNHNWQKDSRKFVYSIRHMYGLEGGRKNYSSQSCSSLCTNIPGPNYEGGCPFKNFDANALCSLLKSFMPESEMESFLTEISELKPEIACTKLLRFKCKNVQNDFVLNNPVQYYMKMIEPS